MFTNSELFCRQHALSEVSHHPHPREIRARGCDTSYSISWHQIAFAPTAEPPDCKAKLHRHRDWSSDMARNASTERKPVTARLKPNTSRRVSTRKSPAIYREHPEGWREAFCEEIKKINIAGRGDRVGSVIELHSGGIFPKYPTPWK